MAVWNEASAEKGKHSHEVDKSTCCFSGPGITALRQTSLHNACSRCCSPASNPLLQMCPVVGSTPGCLVDRSKENPEIDFRWGNVFQLIMLTPNIPSIKSPKQIWFFFYYNHLFKNQPPLLAVHFTYVFKQRLHFFHGLWITCFYILQSISYTL